MKKAKVAILGGSRGLGAAILQLLIERNHPILMCSRKPSQNRHEMNWHAIDFTKREAWPDLITTLNDFSPEILFYCAGGGPFGRFGEKDWKSQEWALQATFGCPAHLIWSWCRGDALNDVQKFVVIGSAIADNRPDPQAAMYCAAKHALRGLISTIQDESPDKDLSLFRAPYMDTSLLPPGAWPRQQDGLVRPPREVALQLLKLHDLAETSEVL